MDESRINLAKRMHKHLDSYLSKEHKKKLEDDLGGKLLFETLYCLSEFVQIEQRQALIKFTARISNGKKDSKPNNDNPVDNEKLSELLDDLSELG